MRLKKENMIKALEILATDANVYVPSLREKIKRYVLWEPGCEVALDGENTVLPPKDILFPQTEKMYSYQIGENLKIKEIKSKQKQVVFGIRPCDMASVERMDRVFLGNGYVDSYYARKRENTLFMALACPQAGRACFCDSMGLDPAFAPDADLMMLPNGSGYTLEALTSKGEEAMQLLLPALDEEEAPKELLGEKADARETEERSGEEGAKPALPQEAEFQTKCTLKAAMTSKLPKKLEHMFEHPIWDEFTRACIGCGTCAYVCPTCYCFDIGSENRGAEGTKFRCWDSCMFSDYSRMAGGHDPRPTKKERVRNRYLHKLSYFYERYGEPLCVGCGRCIEKCPAHMDISQFIDKAGEVEENER